MKIDVSIVIVHWNNTSLLKKLLTRLGKHNNLEITVVDNNSDEVPTWIKRPFSHVRLIQNSANLGYSKACNIGATGAKGEWLLFLNDDLEISLTQIEKMIAYLDEHSLSVGSPIPETNDYQKPLPSSLSLLAEFTPLKHFIVLSDFKDRTLFGGCILIKKTVFEKIGKWSEDFFIWFEDSDLTKRLIDKGYHIGWIPIKIKHIGGESFSKLSNEEQKILFFAGMNTYAKRNFTWTGRGVVKILRLRYLKRF